MPKGDAKGFLVKAQRSLEEGRFEDAKAAIEEGYSVNPDDSKVRDFYQQILMADGVRQSRRARDMRRDEIRSLGKGARGSYEDSTQVREAFEAAVGSLDKVLSVDPSNAKALMLKAGILDRLDRRGRRDEVIQLFRRALEGHPGNEELLYARDKITTPCSNCGDSGLCPDCRGAGEVSALFVRSSCPSCKGTGVCSRCGLL